MEGTTMTHRAFAVIRALFGERTETSVHFHRGPAGHPAVCYDERCPNPRLSV
jgi:hypothetical protein